MISLLRSLKQYYYINKEKAKLYKKSSGLILGNNNRIQHAECIEIGDNCVFGDNCKLLCTTAYNGKQLPKLPRLKIGNNFHATRDLTIQCAGETVIEDNVLFASNIFVIDYNHGTNPLTNNYLENPLIVSSGVRICDGVWIGNNVIILPGVTIGKKSIIGAGAVVVNDIPEYSIAVGNPARVVKEYNLKTKKWVKIEE